MRRNTPLSLTALTLALALASAGLPAARAAAPAAKPNVIFILTDDQGWGDARFAGHPYVKTPNLDRLAAEGTWFKQFYVAATVCSPSRCAFMTSHCPARHEIHGHFADHALNAARHMPDWLDPSTVTVAQLLRGEGYATAHFGKWHLGNGAGAPAPCEYGFDVSRVVNGNGPALGEKEPAPAGAGKKRPEQADPYFRAKSTAMIVDATIEFITAHKDRPFYVNAWTLLPHAPLKPTPEQLAVYEGLAPRADDPAFGAWMRKYLAEAKDLKSQMQVFCASLTDLDTQVGRLLRALDALGLSERTIVFFSSDNGPEDYRIGNAANAGVGSAGPLRARKRSMYEGGIRTFGLVRWPGRVARRRGCERHLARQAARPADIASLGMALPRVGRGIPAADARGSRRPVEALRESRRRRRPAFQHSRGPGRAPRRRGRASGRRRGARGQGARMAAIAAAERGARRRGRDARADRRTAPGREGEERRAGETLRDGALNREEFLSVGAR